MSLVTLAAHSDCPWCHGLGCCTLEEAGEKYLIDCDCFTYDGNRWDKERERRKRGDYDWKSSDMETLLQ